MKYICLYTIFFLIALFFSACCGTDFEIPEFCAEQVFEETRIAPVEFIYTVNTSGKFLEAHKLTAQNLQKALNIGGTNFKVKKMGLTSAFMAYKKAEDNQASAMFVNLGAVDNSLGLVLLMKQNQLVPLVDIPATFFSPEVNINKFLNENGVKELSKLLEVYAEAVNDEGLSFIVTGESSPKGQKMHFQVKVIMNVAIQYEVCLYAPLGKGSKLCE